MSWINLVWISKILRLLQMKWRLRMWKMSWWDRLNTIMRFQRKAFKIHGELRLERLSGKKKEISWSGKWFPGQRQDPMLEWVAALFRWLSMQVLEIKEWLVLFRLSSMPKKRGRQKKNFWEHCAFPTWLLRIKRGILVLFRLIVEWYVQRQEQARQSHIYVGEMKNRLKIPWSIRLQILEGWSVTVRSQAVRQRFPLRFSQQF